MATANAGAVDLALATDNDHGATAKDIQVPHKGPTGSGTHEMIVYGYYPSSRFVCNCPCASVHGHLPMDNIQWAMPIIKAHVPKPLCIAHGQHSASPMGLAHGQVPMGVSMGKDNAHGQCP